MMATFNVKDPQKLQEYMQKSKQLASTYGAELLIKGDKSRALNELHPLGHVAVIVKFPGDEQLNAWFDSPEYQAIVPLRNDAADMNMVSYTE